VVIHRIVSSSTFFTASAVAISFSTLWTAISLLESIRESGQMLSLGHELGVKRFQFAAFSI
jgi:hypothetical protein